MELAHEFTVPADLATTWAAFNDIESVATCFPGAAVTAVEGDTFQGTCKVKLGPIALVYNGSGTFTEKDETAGRMVIEAKGKDKRGNGTAGAHVVATLAPDGGGTRVTVHTDLNITGKPAQFGRGVMQDVSDKLLGQFTACLEDKLGGGETPGDLPAATPVDDGEAATAPPAPETPAPEPQPRTIRDADAGRPAAAGAVPTGAAADRPTSRPAGQDDALDLGATVLPVLLRTYWPQALGGVVVLMLVLRLLRRRRQGRP